MGSHVDGQCCQLTAVIFKLNNVHPVRSERLLYLFSKCWMSFIFRMTDCGFIDGAAEK